MPTYESAGGIGPSRYFRVAVAPEEMVCDGKGIPFTFFAGTIDIYGRITIWYPVGQIPAGYEQAARKLLIAARRDLVDQDLIHAS